jgi:cyclic pyranopterin phosphate synthase
MLASLDGVRDIALTTNGSLLTRAKAHALRDAGLRRITISLDALDDALFRRINDVDFSVTRVLDAIDAAAEAGMSPIKIDMVVRRGMNDTSVVAMARRFRGTGHIVRFIEFMDVGNTNGWRLEDVVPGREIVETLSREWPLEPVDAQYFGEVAERWRYVDGGGEIGVITSVTQPFCGTCTRARLTASGELFTCLFSGNGHDLRALVRSGASDEELAAAVAKVWRARDDRYSEIRSEATVGLPRVEMSRIGG